MQIKYYKKFYVIIVVVLVLVFGTTAFASLTFTTNSITGTAASTIDLGSGNTLSLQTTNNAPITTGTGLVTLGGALTVNGLLKLGTNALVLRSGGNGVGTTVVGDINTAPSLTGASNIALGAYALNSGTTSNKNTAVGTAAMYSAVGGASENVSVGMDSLNQFTTGSQNVAVGNQSGYQLITGYDNVLVGHNAGYSLGTSSDNTLIGYYAGFNSTGSNLVVVGSEALEGNTTGTNNVALGYMAGFAPAGVTANKNTTGAQNTYLGTETGADSTTQRSNTTLVGYRALSSASNQVVLGNASVTEVQAGTGGVAKVTATGVKYVTNTRPTCDATTRGTTWYVAGGAGVADTFAVCAKDVADAYAWRTIY